MRINTAFSPRRITGFQRGSAIVEMAVMLPVLVILFIGMVEFGHFIMMRERMNKVANQITGNLYQLSTQDLESDIVIHSILNQASTLALPYDAPKITLRVCEYRSDSSGNTTGVYRILKMVSKDGGGAACANQAEVLCTGGQANSATASGHGAFVQATSCSSYQPLITQRLFELFNESLAIQTTSYNPLNDTNQTNMIYELGGKQRIKEGGGGTDIKPDPPKPGDETCPITSCPAGQVLQDASSAGCYCGTAEKCQTPLNGCAAGEVWQSSSCSCVVKCGTPITCTEGSVWDMSSCSCKAIQCPDTPCGQLGETRVAPGCNCIRTTCPPGYINPPNCEAELHSACTPPYTDIHCYCRPPGVMNNGKCEAREWCPSGQQADPKTGNCVSECTLNCSTGYTKSINPCACVANDCPSGTEGVNTSYGSRYCMVACASDEKRNPDTLQCESRCNRPEVWVEAKQSCELPCSTGYEMNAQGSCVKKCISGCYRDETIGLCMKNPDEYCSQQ